MLGPLTYCQDFGVASSRLLQVLASTTGQGISRPCSPTHTVHVGVTWGVHRTGTTLGTLPPVVRHPNTRKRSCGDILCGPCIQRLWESLRELEERLKDIKCRPPLQIAHSSDEFLSLRNHISRLGRPYEKVLANYCPKCTTRIRRAPTTCVNFASIITDCLIITHRSDDHDSEKIPDRRANTGSTHFLNFCFEGLFFK